MAVKNRASGMQLDRFVIDGGNAWVKYIIGESEGRYVHRVAELSPTEYKGAQERFGRTAPLDFIAVHGKYYAIGETAENYRVMARQKRAKYERDYYGVLFANAIARTFASDPDLLTRGLRVVASHASSDFGFRTNLRDSIKGKWAFECGGVKFNFSVSGVETYEEPFGGYARCAFRRGKRGWETPLYGQAVGILDIGGGTCGCLAVAEDGTVRYNVAYSGENGVNTAMRRLKTELENRYQDFFRQGTPEEKRLRATLMTGVYRGGGRELECHDEVEMSLAPLLNEVMAMYTNQLEGGVNIDALVLTGGGNAILHERVTNMLGFPNIILADTPEDIQFANVRGARTFVEVLESAI